MTTRIPSLIAMAGLLLGGCTQSASPPGGAASANCNPNQCQLKVKVANNCASASDITVEPDTMPVPRQNHQVKMHWDIETAGFKFVQEPDGITFSTAPLPPANEFHDANATANNTKYNLTNANTATTPTDYKYNVKLTRSDGTACAVKDPFIRNGAN